MDNNPIEDQSNRQTPGLVEKPLSFLKSLLKFERRQVDELPTGKRAGNNEFIKFVGVWIGLVIPLTAGTLARASENDTFARAQELYEADLVLAWGIVLAILAATFLGSGLIAHSHSKVSYGHCIWVGMRWGGGILAIFAIAPVVYAVLTKLERLLL